jgi:hypothetical protein
MPPSLQDVSICHRHPARHAGLFSNARLANNHKTAKIPIRVTISAAYVPRSLPKNWKTHKMLGGKA